MIPLFSRQQAATSLFEGQTPLHTLKVFSIRQLHSVIKYCVFLSTYFSCKMSLFQLVSLSLFPRSFLITSGNSFSK